MNSVDVYVHTYVCVYVCMYVRMYVCVCMYMYSVFLCIYSSDHGILQLFGVCVSPRQDAVLVFVYLHDIKAV